MVIGKGGFVDLNKETRNFNEYMMVSFLASKYGKHKIAKEAYNVFKNPMDCNQTPQPNCVTVNMTTYDYKLLSDGYASPDFSKHENYRKLFDDYANLDHDKWYNSAPDANLWGTAAGETAYSLSEENPNLVYSLPVMAGYLQSSTSKFQTEIKKAIRAIYKGENKLAQTGVRKLRINGQDIKVLWRASLVVKNWVPNRLQTVDYAPFVLGWATSYVGYDFYKKYNK
eukprot:Pgem_evm1s3042